MTRYGATPEEWNLWAYTLGYREDLLPVVMNPEAKKHSSSRLQGRPGKMPSHYISPVTREYAGFCGWSKYRTSIDDILSWSREPDYGICLNMRTLRALDIDVDDPEKSQEIQDIVLSIIGPAPVRYREDSPRVLILVRPDKTAGKRILRLKDNGAVEYLGNGNQGIVAGTHVQGARYQWRDLGELTPPEVTGGQIEEIFTMIHRISGVLDDNVFNSPVRIQSSEPVDETDPVIPFLSNVSLGRGPTGQVFIRCPFESEHTTEGGGPSATVYFPRGRGYSEGHFKCMHAHCEDRVDADFLYALGYTEATAIETLRSTEMALSKPRSLFEGFKRHKSDNEIILSHDNVYRAISRPELIRYEFQFDRFTGKNEMRPYNPGDDGPSNPVWREVTDLDVSIISTAMSSGGIGFRASTSTGKMVKEAIAIECNRKQVDSAYEWISGLPWDGVPRIATFFPDLLMTEDSPYTRAVGEYMWTAMAGRAAGGYVRADMIPVLISPEGFGKTSVIPRLAVHSSFHSTISFRQEFRDIVWNMRGRLIAEIPELDGLSKRDQEAVKAFITRDSDDFREHFKMASVRDERRWFLIATSNYKDILSGVTGNRRWLPVEILKPIDLQKVSDVVLQLWAEGYQKYCSHGRVPMYQSAERLAQDVIEEYRVASSLEERTQLFTSKITEHTRLPGTEILSKVLHDVGVNGVNQKEFYAILRRLGWIPKITRSGNSTVRLWHYSPKCDT